MRSAIRASGAISAARDRRGYAQHETAQAASRKQSAATNGGRPAAAGCTAASRSSAARTVREPSAASSFRWQRHHHHHRILAHHPLRAVIRPRVSFVCSVVLARANASAAKRIHSKCAHTHERNPVDRCVVEELCSVREGCRWEVRRIRIRSVEAKLWDLFKQ